MTAEWAAADVAARHLPPPRGYRQDATWRGLTCLAEPPSATTQRPGCAPMGQEAGVSEARAADGHHGPQQAPDACVGLARPPLESISLTTGTRGEAHLAVADRDEAMLGERDPVRRAADVMEDLGGAGAGRLQRDAPRVVAAWGGEVRKALWRTQGCRWTRERDGIVRDGLLERRQERAAQHPAQGLHREEETGGSGEPARAVTRSCPAWHDAVDVEVRPQRLVPSRSDHGTASLPAEVLLPALAQGLAGRFAQQRQQRTRWQVEMEGVPAPCLGLEELQPTGSLVARTPRQAAFD